MKHILLICLALTASQSHAEASVDASTGLIVAPGWEDVRAHCGACHSHRLVTSNRGDKRQWLASIRWMQKKHNLWPLPAATEQRMLDYLSSEYSAAASSRRRNLEPEFLP